MKFKKLVVLDKVTMQGRQESELRKLAEETKIFRDNPKNKKETIKRIGNSDAIITSWVDINKEVLDSCPNLKYMGVWATGYSWIDTKHARKRGITVTNVPDYATESVAELVFGQLISLLRKTKQADDEIRNGKFEFEKFMGEELKGKTLGIIGLGRIGTRVSEIARAFGMDVIYFSRTRNPEQESGGIKYETLEELVKKSDIITLHASSSQEILTSKLLDQTNPGLVIVNMGVGGSVNEDALIKNLKSGRLRAVLDVFEDHKIKKGIKEAPKENIILSPHIAFYTRQAIFRLTQACIENARSYLDGKTKNKVN